jgi:hypothetical protein
MDPLVSTSELRRHIKPKSVVLPGDSAPSIDRRPVELSFWTGVAPANVVKHYCAVDEGKAWRAWQRYLARRAAPSFADPNKIRKRLLWGTHPDDLDAEGFAAIDGVGRAGDVDHDQVRSPHEMLVEQSWESPNAALLHLFCSYQLPSLAQRLSDTAWWELLGLLQQAAIDAAAVDLTTQPLLHQRLAGELPLVLSSLFPEIMRCAELLASARRALSIGFEELLDGEGMPQCRYLSEQQSLVACWSRARMLARLVEGGCWNEEAEAQYRLAVREMLRVARCDGSPPFVTRQIGKRYSSEAASFFAAAVKLSGDSKNRRILRNFDCGDISNTSDASKPAPANQSEWAQAALLRPDWKRSSPRLALTYGNRVVHAELSVGRDIVFLGEWGFSCFVGEEQAFATDEWEEVCWVSDDDVDYLELEINLTHGLKIQRQICLARKDRFLFLADAVLGNAARPLRHTLHLPWTSDVRAESATESREVHLNGRKPIALVFPLALSEWRIDARGGELLADDRGLELRRTTVGTSLFAPLWIDLDPSRHDKPFTWRQLTVAEERQIQVRDVAVGYRLQFGKKQWLVYRSLGRVANRTVLGHNLSTDFLIARFGRNGHVKPVLEVE